MKRLHKHEYLESFVRHGSKTQIYDVLRGMIDESARKKEAAVTQARLKREKK